jgi:hypothetical protein
LPHANKMCQSLNRRWSAAIRADRPRCDVTHLLRVPGTPNFNYAGTPLVRILELKDKRYDPAELDPLLPPLLPEGMKLVKSVRPEGAGTDANLARLSPKMQDQILHVHRRQYRSSSETGPRVWRCSGPDTARRRSGRP